MTAVRNSLFFLLVCAYAALGQSVKFTSEGPSEPIPFEIANNLVVVKASAGRAAAGWFIFDTGAESTVIDSKYASIAGLTHSGTTIGTGSAGTAVAGVLKGVAFTVGNVTATDLTVYSLPLGSFSPGLGMNVAGIIGNDIIAKTIAEIDYANQRLTLHRPGAFRPPSSAEVIPIRVQEHLPMVDAPIVIAGKTAAAKMEIDTGSTGAVLFNAPFVRRHALARSFGRTLRSRTGGVGGTGSSLVARIAMISFGATPIREPLAVLYTGTKGDNASSSYDGLLGGAIFRRFKMTIDLEGKHLYLEPTVAVADPFETDMSGMDLLADGDDLSRILVDEVKAASVAAKAGVRGGELLRSVNARPVSELGLQEVRKTLRTPGEVDLELVRGRRVFTVHLRLKRVI